MELQFAKKREMSLTPFARTPFALADQTLPETQRTYTDKFIADRAALLSWKSKLGLENVTTTPLNGQEWRMAA